MNVVGEFSGSILAEDRIIGNQIPELRKESQIVQAIRIRPRSTWITGET